MGHKNDAEKSTKVLNRILIFAIAFVEFALLTAVIFTIDRQDILIYYKISVGIVAIWLGILVPYYAWAIYFYNINLGQTNEDWAEYREKTENFPEADIEPPALINPHHYGSLGLPPGTIRGTIALTVTVGGLAMLIASLGMSSSIKENAMFIDNLEFFKKAFLMVIAFYFGTRGVEQIINTSNKQQGNAISDVSDVMLNEQMTAANAHSSKMSNTSENNEVENNEGNLPTTSEKKLFELPGAKG